MQKKKKKKKQEKVSEIRTNLKPKLMATISELHQIKKQVFVPSLYKRKLTP